jgi:hypothetical protein
MIGETVTLSTFNQTRFKSFKDFNNLIKTLIQRYPSSNITDIILGLPLNDIEHVIRQIHKCYFHGHVPPTKYTTFDKQDLHCFFMIDCASERELRQSISKLLVNVNSYQSQHFKNIKNVGQDCSQKLFDLQSSFEHLINIALKQPQSYQIKTSPPSTNLDKSLSTVCGGEQSDHLDNTAESNNENTLSHAFTVETPQLDHITNHSYYEPNKHLSKYPPGYRSAKQQTPKASNASKHESEFTAFIAHYFNKIDNLTTVNTDEPKHNPTPNTHTPSSNIKEIESGTLESALNAHNIVLSSQLNNLKTTFHNSAYPTLPSSFENSKQCRRIIEAINLVKDPSIFNGISSLNRSKLMKNALARTSTQQKNLLKMLKSLALEQGINLKDSNTITKPIPYNLKSLPLPKLERDKLRAKLNKGNHLSPEAAFQASLSSLSMTKSLAILDSGASKHFITQHLRSKLINPREMKATMFNANGVKTELTEGGDLKLNMTDSNGNNVDTLFLSEVNVIPDAGFNLISLTKLFETGAKFELAAEGCFLLFNGRKYPIHIQRGLLIMNLEQPLCAQEESEEVSAFAMNSSISDVSTDEVEHIACAAAAAPLKVWHDRLGHASKSRIKFLHKSGTALGMNMTGLETHDSKCKCEACLKTNNISYGISSSRQFSDCTSRKGQIITTDCLGPFPHSVEGYQYAISFTDEYSRFSMVYLLKKKSDAPEAVESLARYYRSMNLIISEIRHDQGGEFGGAARPIHDTGYIPSPTPELSRDVYSKGFKAACSRNHIISHAMPAYKPELHGIAERWNKTVTQIANAIMYKAKISPILWSAAIMHANHIRNHLPTRSRSGYTPQELFTNRKPRYENFRVWGCYCYKKLPVYRKLPGLPVRKRLIYLGESNDSTGFKCFDPQTYKITSEFELIFDEESVNKRTTLLEAYDNRRNLIGNSDKVEGIPLVVDLDHSSTEERAIFSATPAHRISTTTNLNIENTQEKQSTSESEPLNIDRVNLITDSSLKDSQVSGGSIRTDTNESMTVPPPDNDHHRSSCVKNDSLSLTPSQSKPSLRKNSPSHSNSTHSNPNNPDYCGMEKVNTDKSNPQLSSKPNSNARETSEKGGNLEAQSINKLNPRPESDLGFDIDIDDVIFTEPESINQSPKSNTTNKQSIFSDCTPLPRNSTPDLSGDEFDLVVNNTEQENGPLSAINVQTELDLQQYDLTPGHLRCPMRYLKHSQPEESSRELDTFINLAIQENLPVRVCNKNPKSGESAKRYDLYKHANSMLEFFNICKANHLPKSRADFKFDYLRGYITFPYNTHQREPTQHAMAYVDTQSVSIQPDDIDEALISSELPSETSFNDIIKQLWPHDAYASDEALQIEANNALAMVTELLAESASPTKVPEPTSYKKAVDPNNPERDLWIASIKRELNTLIDRNTWSYVDKHLIPKGRRPIRCKYVFKRKFNKDGTVQYKTRLVACGVTQRPGLDYSSEELYASVCSYSSMRFLMSLATQNQMQLYQTDIQGAYLEAYLDDEIYMHNPEGIEGHDHQFCRLVRGLYGCKQSGWAWSQCFKEFMTSDPKYDMDFKPMTGEPNLYRKRFSLNGVDEEIFVGQYVDDCLIAASSTTALEWYNTRLKERFPVNPKSSGYISKENPGLLLSMQVEYDLKQGILSFNQERAISALAEKFQLTDSHKALLPLHATNELEKLDKPEDPSFPNKYLSMIGSCLHICQVSRPDCSYAVGVLARHSAAPGIQHMKAAENLIKYLYHTRNWCIQYKRSDSHASNIPYIYEKASFPLDKQPPNYSTDLSQEYKYSVPPRTIEERLTTGYDPKVFPNHPITYIDANLAGDRITRKSTSGLVIMMNGGPIIWCSRLQKLCAQSSAESEIIAVVDSVKEALHIKLLCEESGIRPPNIPMEVQEDNNACIHLAHNLRGSQQAKHYELRLRFLNEHVLEKNIEFSRVDTTKQLADGFTKPLATHNFRIFRNWLLHNPSHEPPITSSSTSSNSDTALLSYYNGSLDDVD